MHPLIGIHRAGLLALARTRNVAVNPGPKADRVLLAHMRDCLRRILGYSNSERSHFDASRLVQDAVISNRMHR